MTAAPAAPPTTAALGAAPAAAPTTPSPGSEVSAPPPRPDRSAPPTAGPPTVSEGSEAVWRHDFPDPHVVRANGSWWAFGTRVGRHAVPTLRSDDLVRWEWVGDALQGMPQWADLGPTWAPAVLPRSNGFVLYYSVRDRASGLLCISRATAVLPQGPYVDRSTEPLVCQRSRGGSIDPSPFVDDDGRPWLLWKSEGTLDGEPTRLWVQGLSDDGLLLLGPRHELLHRALDWEWPIIEAPSMVRVDGRYHLLYSGNRWETGAYAVGHAVCETVTGPCRRTAPHPVLASRDGAAGPGGQEVLRLPDGELALVHHAWDPAAVGYPHGARMLHVARLHVEGDRLVVGGPRREARPAGLLDIGR
ncbi:MAG: glycoside hydrolase family 43 protein [Acidimicrobiia bacterium]